MTLSRLTRVTGAALAAGLVFAVTPASAVVAAEPPFSGLIAFDDSLTDDGNLFALFGQAYPAAPYYQGRFSNGPVAVEILASGLGLGGAQFNDLALAGARTGLSGSADGTIGRATGMLTQLAGFQAALGSSGLADGNALYFVWGGANDMRDAFAARNVQGGLTTAITNLVTIVSTLHGLGATNFFLPNLPDLGLTPEARSQPDPIQGVSFSSLATSASEAFNQQLSAAYGSLAAQWTDEHFYYYNAMAEQRAISDGAPGNGFTNVTTACIGTAACATSLYFDAIHPTAAAHQILGSQMLAAVPEPQTMLMLAAGLLVLLGVAKRRRA